MAERGKSIYEQNHVTGTNRGQPGQRAEIHWTGPPGQAAALLPSLEVLDKILRYETKLERQMFRAMAQLERLQRMRRGEAVPAPLTVEVSEKP